MEERDRTQIEKYFANELSAQEKNTMEQRLITDTEFAIEFEAYRQAVEALKLAQREELKKRFRERDRILDKKENPSSGNNRYLFLLAAAVVIIVAGIWVLNNFKGPQSENNIAVPQDTLQTQEVSKAVQDSVSREEKIPMASNEEKDDNKWKEGEVNGEALFAANFEPYMDESLEGTVRGDEEEMLPEERFLSSYSEGQFDVAVESFAEMNDTHRQNRDLQFLYANALLAEGLADGAINYFKGIISDKQSDYAVEANYYLGLAYLKKKNYTEAKKYLTVYAAGDHQHTAKAKGILAKIK